MSKKSTAKRVFIWKYERASEDFSPLFFIVAIGTAIFFGNPGSGTGYALIGRRVF